MTHRPAELLVRARAGAVLFVPRLPGVAGGRPNLKYLKPLRLQSLELLGDALL